MILTYPDPSLRMILAKKQVNDFLESSWWPVRSLDVVALLELEDFQQVRNLRFEMPCWLRLGCSRPDMEERALLPPAPPLEASWPSNVVAVGLHTTSTLEVVTALRLRRESYAMDEARAALRWAPRRLEPVRQAELIVCTFPTVLCVLLHEFFPETPQLYVAIANPLFAAPGCTKQEETSEFLLAFRSMLSDGVVRGVAAYTVTTALVAYQAGVVLPLAGG
eukprot:g19515.t1